jgi:hypothetical protein
LGVLLGAVVLLLGVTAGVRAGGVRETLTGTTSPAVTTTGLFGSGAGGAADTRVQRDVEGGKRQPSSRLDGIGGSPALAQASQRWVTALAAALERAGHPERVGHILLRGPPATSA